MKVSELLKLPDYAEAVVSAGTDGLNRRVQSVNMMDAPDIIDYLRPDELLLTTAYALKDQPDALYTLVARMAEQGCAGLGIKVKRFWSSVPSEVTELADRLSFPVIELPFNRSLGELLNSSLSHILEKRTEELREALRTHRSFSQLVLKGKGIGAILDSLAALLDCPALMLDERLEPLALARIPQTKEREALVKTVRDGLERLPEPEFSSPLPLEMPNLKEDWRTATAYPVQTAHNHRSWLLLFAPLREEESVQRLAVEQAVNVIEFELMKRQAVKERSRRYKNDFFSDWVEGRVVSEQELMNRGEKYGLTGNSVFQCVVCKSDPVRPQTESFPDSEERVQAERDRMYVQLKRAFAKCGLPFILFGKNDLFVFVLTDAQLTTEYERLLIEKLEDVQSELLSVLQCGFSFGVGKPAARSMELPKVYKEALEALEAGYAAKEGCFIRTYRAKDMLDLLRLVPVPDLAAFYVDTFGDLLKSEEKERSELMQTLRTFVETEGQIAETAKRLFLHRNTVIYRIGKCERLTGRNLKDPSDTLRLRLAFHMEPLLP
jgi:purine catabolism regulator